MNGVDHCKVNGEESDEHEKDGETSVEKSIALFLTLFGIHTR